MAAFARVAAGEENSISGWSGLARTNPWVAGLFALLYGVFRFAVEFVRVPDAQMGTDGYLAFGWLTMGQLLSLPLVALGLFLLWRSHSAPVLQPAVPAKGDQA